MQILRYLVFSILLWGAVPVVPAAEEPTALPALQDGYPSLLGVWKGDYEMVLPEGHVAAEIWLEVAWQQGKSISGMSRWNHRRDEDAAATANDQAPADNFARFSGVISPDRQSVTLVEEGNQGTIAATIADTDVLEALYTGQGKPAPVFHTRLQRINTHYTPHGEYVLGVDISHHSGDVDWARVKAAGYQFAYVKASEGVDNPDARFAAHWQALADAGLPRGAYHYYVTEDDPEAQARLFLSRLGDAPGDLPPVVDLEALGHGTQVENLTGELIRYLEAVHKGTGMRPMIYTNPRFWDHYYHPDFSEYSLWLGEYGVVLPKVPFGWERWDLWQFAGDQKVDGVEKTADISRLHPASRLPIATTASSAPET